MCYLNYIYAYVIISANGQTYKITQIRIINLHVGTVSYIVNVTWLAGDIREYTQSSKTVGHVFPSVVDQPCLNRLVLYIGLNSVHQSPLDKIVQEQLLHVRV